MESSLNVVADDAFLARRAAEGDERAFAEIVELYDAQLRRLCYVICGDVHTADDAVQAAWEKAWRGMHTLKRPEALRAWLSRIAINETRQSLRRTRALQLLRLRARANPTLTHAAPEQIVDLHRALLHLSVRDRQLLGLRYVAGLQLDEISEVLGERASTTRSRLARIHGRLRKELQYD